MNLHVPRYLAYVTHPHDWRISMACGNWKASMKKKNPVSAICAKHPFEGKKSKMVVT